MEREQLNHAPGLGEEAQSVSHAFGVSLRDIKSSSLNQSVSLLVLLQ